MKGKRHMAQVRKFGALGFASVGGDFMYRDWRLRQATPGR